MSAQEMHLAPSLQKAVNKMVISLDQAWALNDLVLMRGDDIWVEVPEWADWMDRLYLFETQSTNKLPLYPIKWLGCRLAP